MLLIETCEKTDVNIHLFLLRQQISKFFPLPFPFNHIALLCMYSPLSRAFLLPSSDMKSDVKLIAIMYIILLQTYIGKVNN